MSKMDASIPKFDCYSDPATLGPRWTRWLYAFELFADGKGLILTDNASVATKQRRRALLLHHAGTDVQDIFSTLADTGGPTDYEQAVTALNAYFVPQVNAAFARQTFYQLKHKAEQTVQQFVTCLRQSAKDCDFGADKDNQIRDAVLSLCNSEYVRRKLLEEGTDLTLARTLEIAAQCERVELQMAALHVSSDSEIKETVSLVSKKGARDHKKRMQYSKGGTYSDKTCYRCGQTGNFAHRNRLNAKTSDIEVGDRVLVRQDKTDKFTTTFHSTPHKVIHREGNSVIVQSPTGAKYTRNTTFVKKFHSMETPTVIHDMKCAQEPSSDGEQKGITEECKINCETIQREEQTPKSCRPQRQIKLPERLGDYVIE